MVILMKIKCLICDIDGSLMNPSAGLYVSKEIEDKLIELQRRGFLIILNSARTLQGVKPLSEQIKMNEFGGYLISCNGANVKNAKTNKTLFEYSISANDCLAIWNICKEYDLKPGFTQPKYGVCQEMTLGFYLDKENCQMDYMVTHNPENHVEDSIWKMCISESKEKLDESFDVVKKVIESKYNVEAIRSTDTLGDVISREVSKFKTCDRLLKMLNISWENVSVIGDGYADLECIKSAKLGVVPQNGKEEVKKEANFIVPSCYEDGANVWLNLLLEERL